MIPDGKFVLVTHRCLDRAGLFEGLGFFFETAFAGFFWGFHLAADKNDHDLLLCETLFMLGRSIIDYQFG
jgi:hypothetical protein